MSSFNVKLCDSVKWVKIGRNSITSDENKDVREAASSWSRLSAVGLAPTKLYFTAKPVSSNVHNEFYTNVWQSDETRPQSGNNDTEEKVINSKKQNGEAERGLKYGCQGVLCLTFRVMGGPDPGRRLAAD